MFYKGINLHSVIVDPKSTERWSACKRAYELFGESLSCSSDDVEISDTQFPWIKLIYNQKFPIEVYQLINVRWNAGDFLNAKAIASKATEIAEIADQRYSLTAQMSNFLTNDQFQDSESKAEFLEMLESSESEGSVFKVCRTLGIPKKKYDLWMIRDITFRESVELISEVIIDSVEHEMIKTAKNGEFSAQKYFLDHRGSERGYGKNAKERKSTGENLNLDLLTYEEQTTLQELIIKATPAATTLAIGVGG